MYAHEYQILAERTKSTNYTIPLTGDVEDIIHAAFGVATEGGEILDAIKKYIFYGKNLDVTNLDEEMGDVLWYIAIYCNARQITIEHLMKQNIDKLSTRYPERFTEYHALHRDLVAEREALENANKG